MEVIPIKSFQTLAIIILVQHLYIISPTIFTWLDNFITSSLTAFNISNHEMLIGLPDLSFVWDIDYYTHDLKLWCIATNGIVTKETRQKDAHKCIKYLTNDSVIFFCNNASHLTVTGLLYLLILLCQHEAFYNLYIWAGPALYLLAVLVISVGIW